MGMTTTAMLTTRGTLTLPKKMRTYLALQGETTVLLETTSEGILVRPAAVTPIEIYSDERLAEFDRENNAALAGILPRGKTKARRA